MNSRHNIYQTNGLHRLLHFHNGRNDCSQKFDIVTDNVLIVISKPRTHIIVTL